MRSHEVVVDSVTVDLVLRTCEVLEPPHDLKNKKEIVGYIPTTDHLEIVRDLTAAYLKKGVRFFAVDFSGAHNQPSLMRTIVRTIREKLKIKKLAKEKDEKYYLHAFNVATARKSTRDVSPISDIIAQPYGVDSTSSTMWGGGTLDMNKLRYYNTDDYGAYRRKALSKKGIFASARPVLTDPARFSLDRCT